MTLTVEEAIKTGEKLQNAFADVVVHGAVEPIHITGKKHFRLRTNVLSACDHSSRRFRISKNITAGLVQSLGGRRRLTRADKNHPLREFKTVTCCADCDVVVGVEESDV